VEEHQLERKDVAMNDPTTSRVEDEISHFQATFCRDRSFYREDSLDSGFSLDSGSVFAGSELE